MVMNDEEDDNDDVACGLTQANNDDAGLRQFSISRFYTDQI